MFICEYARGDVQYIMLILLALGSRPFGRSRLPRTHQQPSYSARGRRSRSRACRRGLRNGMCPRSPWSRPSARRSSGCCGFPAGAVEEVFQHLVKENTTGVNTLQGHCDLFVWI